MEPATLKEWPALCGLVFVLGLKHGFDADHLVTINGLARFNSRVRPRLALFCGTLFSIGHGGAVIAIALAVSAFAWHWQTPEWLSTFGAWVSITFLLALGLINVQAVLRAHPGEIVQPVGFRSRFLFDLSRVTHPVYVVLVGALFALSFDTISLATLFALMANPFGGWQQAVMLGLLFMLGMLVTDGVNGLWISRLIMRADQTAALASRIMSLTIAGTSLLLGAWGVMKMSLPAFGSWSDGREWLGGGAAIAIAAGGFVLALRFAQCQSGRHTSAPEPVVETGKECSQAG